MTHPSSSAIYSTIGYCVSDILMTIFFILDLSPSLAMGTYLELLSVLISFDAYESSSSLSEPLFFFAFITLLTICDYVIFIFITISEKIIENSNAWKWKFEAIE